MVDLQSMPTYVHGFRNELNLRDLGGEATPDGRMMRRLLIFRSGALGSLTSLELIRLHSLNLRYVLDLRSKAEAEEDPDPNLPGVEQVRICGAIDASGHELDLSFGGIIRILLRPRRRAQIQKGRPLVSRLAQAYASMAFDNQAYKELFHQLEVGNVPLLFHCSQGKDRTGVAAMLVLLALGYSEDTVIDRYVLTNQYLRENLSKLIDGHRRLMSTVPVLRLAAQAGEGVIREFGEGVLEEILRQYGSFEAYFEKEYGLDNIRLKALRDRYLEKPKPLASKENGAPAII